MRWTVIFLSVAACDVLPRVGPAAGSSGLGVGDACATDPQCAAGLTCENGACAVKLGEPAPMSDAGGTAAGADAGDDADGNGQHGEPHDDDGGKKD
jgi:hypothetical protein